MQHGWLHRSSLLLCWQADKQAGVGMPCDSQLAIVCQGSSSLTACETASGVGLGGGQTQSGLDALFTREVSAVLLRLCGRGMLQHQGRNTCRSMCVWWVCVWGGGRSGRYTAPECGQRPQSCSLLLWRALLQAAWRLRCTWTTPALAHLCVVPDSFEWSVGIARICV